MSDIFTNIPEGQLAENVSWGVQSLTNIGSLNAGGGTKVFRTNGKDGMWLGAAAFADAPFSVDMNGNITLKLPGSGTAGITISAVNKTIIVNDGSNDRILIGYQAGGF